MQLLTLPAYRSPMGADAFEDMLTDCVGRRLFCAARGLGKSTVVDMACAQPS